MEMTAWLWVVCVRASEDTLKRHSAALNCCLFLKVIILKLDELKLVATS